MAMAAALAAAAAAVNAVEVDVEVDAHADADAANQVRRLKSKKTKTIGADGSSPPGKNTWSFSLPSQTLSVSSKEIVAFTWNSASNGGIPHSLYQVTESDYEACTFSTGAKKLVAAGAKGSHNAGPFKAGTYYFLCASRSRSAARAKRRY